MQFFNSFFSPDYQPSRIRQKCGGCNSHFYELILNILKNNNIVSYYNCGVTKLVYKTNSNKIFKLIIIKDSKLINHYLKEPFYMINNSNICNKPTYITLYIDMAFNNYYKNYNNLITTDVHNIKDYCLLTWFEDMATLPGKTMSEKKDILDRAIKFRENTRKLIKNDGFSDLSLNNMGFFDVAPHFRWFDIRPVKSKHL
tara:strand:- start:1703 stop:2299 length:597 start_codon:yes stop_codon:yes gene_type:complete